MLYANYVEEVEHLKLKLFYVELVIMYCAEYYKFYRRDFKSTEN